MDHTERIRLKYGDQNFVVDVTAHGDDMSYTVHCGSFRGRVRTGVIDTIGVAEVRCELDDEIRTFKCSNDDGRLTVYTDDDVLLFDIPEPSYVAKLGSKSGTVEGGAVAPMPGVVEQVLVSDGQQVTKGQPLVVMIAMKMEVSMEIQIIMETYWFNICDGADERADSLIKWR